MLAVDVVGYTRLVEADGDGTHARPMQLRAGLLQPSVIRHEGRIVKNTGDCFLTTFESVVLATRCAIEIQGEVVRTSQHEPPSIRIPFRMAITLREAVSEAHIILGEGVNVAVFGAAPDPAELRNPSERSHGRVVDARQA